jgi:predicted nucleic acid-binding protein
VSAELVFDNTPLSHFARSGNLDTLEKLVAPYRCITPGEVTTEVLQGIAQHPQLTRVLSASWIVVVELQELDEVVAFARYKAELGGGPDKNNGEAAVLAWVSLHGGIAIIDERAGTRIAQRDALQVHGSLWLVANGVRSGKLARPDAERIVDELASTEMALPVDGAGFFTWAYSEGLLP